jgi:hypothetical protein
MDEREKLEEMRIHAERMAAEIAELKRKIEQWAKERQVQQTPIPKN